MTLYEYLDSNPSITYSKLPDEFKNKYTQASFNTLKLRHSKIKKCESTQQELKQCNIINSRPLRRDLNNFISAIKCFKQTNSYYIAANSILEEDILKISEELNINIVSRETLIENPNLIHTVDEIGILDLNRNQIAKINQLRKNYKFTLYLEIYNQEITNEEILNILKT